MTAQRTEIINLLPSRGWRVARVEDYELQWWADEMWLLESIWSPPGNRAFLTFLVDPQIPDSRNREMGQYVWAVMASPMKPLNWQASDESFTLSLGQGWKERLPDFLEKLDQLRNQKQVTGSRRPSDKSFDLSE